MGNHLLLETTIFGIDELGVHWAISHQLGEVFNADNCFGCGHCRRKPTDEHLIKRSEQFV